MTTRLNVPKGAGLGLRRALLGPLQDIPAAAVDFLEIAPENWIGVGGKLGKRLRAFTERYPFVCHGLSLSLGGPEALDQTLLQRVRMFLDRHNIVCYSEHLSYSSDNGQLYDLMPIPFTSAAVKHVSARIRQAQDQVGRRIAVENVSYYAAPGAEMSELEFLLAVLEEADCDLLLDVNNIHVNSVNHGYDAKAFLDALPAQRVAYIHVAGHYREAEDLIIDTHAAAVDDAVWALLERAYARLGPIGTLLERDFNFPPVEVLLDEVQTIQTLQALHTQSDTPVALSHGS